MFSSGFSTMYTAWLVAPVLRISEVSLWSNLQSALLIWHNCCLYRSTLKKCKKKTDRGAVLMTPGLLFLTLNLIFQSDGV